MREDSELQSAGSTDSTPIRSSRYDVILKLQVLVENGIVELNLSVEAVANLLPIGGRTGHLPGSCGIPTICRMLSWPAMSPISQHEI